MVSPVVPAGGDTLETASRATPPDLAGPADGAPPHGALPTDEAALALVAHAAADRIAGDPDLGPHWVAVARALVGDPVGEVLVLEVRWLAELPMPVTLVVRAPTPGSASAGDPRVFLVSTNPARVAASRAAGEVVLAPLELGRLAFAVQHGRAHQADLLAWLARKAGDSHWKLSDEVALAWMPDLVRELVRARAQVGEDGQPAATEPRITFELLWRRLGCELVEAHVDELGVEQRVEGSEQTREYAL